MLDGQGCLLPVRRSFPEDSQFWHSQRIVCLPEGSIETVPFLNANIFLDSAQACLGNSAPMAEWNFVHRERYAHKASGLAESVDSDSWLAKEDNLPCLSSRLHCKSVSARPSFTETKIRAGLSRRSEKSSSELARGNKYSDIYQAAWDEAMIETGGWRSLDYGGKGIICLCKGKDSEFSDCRERYAGVECFSTLQNENTCWDDKKIMEAVSAAAKNCTTRKETDQSCWRAGNVEETAVLQRLKKHLATQFDRIKCEGEIYTSEKTSLPCAETFQDLSAGNSVTPAAKELGCASNANCSSQQQPYLPGLDDGVALRCLACVPLSGLGQLSKLSKKHRDLITSREIFQVRRTYGKVEHLVFVYTSRPSGWTTYDANRNVWTRLTPANVNSFFNLSDKESLSSGTHLLWFGRELNECVYYRYDLLTNSWEKGPSMVNPRCLFASASCGDVAYVAGGFGAGDRAGSLKLLNSAEMYNSLTGEWERLPPMSTPRHKCSGVFMDGKFYVIGGKDAEHEPITSGEEYDPSTQSWRTIPNMYFTPTITHRETYEPSPPLVAVVNNQLYAVESTTNILKIYNKDSNTWSNLGYLPVSAYLRNGWGVAFKGLGDRLFVMGEVNGIAACCWRPGPTVTEPAWQLLSHIERGSDSFLYNCAVMTC